MPKPQQPELRRSGKGATDRDGKDLRAAESGTDVNDAGGGGVSPVPEENKPGHRPERDEDKPSPPDRG